MRSVKLLGVAVAGLSLAAGCDRQESSKPSPAASTAPAVPSTSASGTPATPVPDASASAAEARQRAAAAESDVRGAATTAVTGARDAATRAQTQAAATTTATAQMTSDEAKSMLDQAMTYIKENKYDLAEKTLNQVEANKAMLPKALQDRLGTVRTALTTAKAGGGLQLPGFGAGSK